MGCDYYIGKYLIIIFSNHISSISIYVERDKGYFYFSLDEVDPDYDEKYDEYIKETLRVHFEPITIYENNGFINNKLENKYKSFIDKELNIYNLNHENKIDWKDIMKIVKKESKYERD